MYKLQVGVLERIGGQFGGDLLRNQYTLPIASDLREHVGKYFYRLAPHIASLYRYVSGDMFEETVSFFNDG